MDSGVLTVKASLPLSEIPSPWYVGYEFWRQLCVTFAVTFGPTHYTARQVNLTNLRANAAWV